MGLPLPLSGQTDSNRWQLDSKTEKVTSLSPGRGTLTNKDTQNSYLNHFSMLFLVYRVKDFVIA